MIEVDDYKKQFPLTTPASKSNFLISTLEEKQCECDIGTLANRLTKSPDELAGENELFPNLYPRSTAAGVPVADTFLVPLRTVPALQPKGTR